jgi:hypothetical protein
MGCRGGHALLYELQTGGEDRRPERDADMAVAVARASPGSLDSETLPSELYQAVSNL